MRQNRIKIVALTFLSSTAALSTLYSCVGDKKAKSTHQVDLKNVTVSKAKDENVRISRTFRVNIEPESSNSISTAIPARIDRIYKDVGDRVRKGEVLVKLDETNLQKLKIQIAELNRNLERMEGLYKIGGVSQQQLESIRSQYDIARQTLKNVQSNTLLTSPVNGYVTQRYSSAGNFASQGPILIVDQLDRLKVKISLSENLFSKIHVNMPVDLTVDLYPDKKISGKISKISPVIDPIAHSFSAEILINNPKKEIRPGMLATVYINFGERNSLVVSDLSLHQNSSNSDYFVYRLSPDSTAMLTKVVPGRHVGDNYEILSGIKEGDVVIAEGSESIENGEKVHVVQSFDDSGSENVKSK